MVMTVSLHYNITQCRETLIYLLVNSVRLKDITGMMQDGLNHQFIQIYYNYSIGI